MIYLQTSCWSLAQRSRLMTLEHGSKSEENCNLICQGRAFKQHMPLIT